MDKFITKKPRIDTATPANVETTASTSGVSFSQQNTKPNDKPIGGRSFQKSWVTKYKWLQYDATMDKVFCQTCKEAEAKGLLQLTTKKEDAFTTVGFSNWKKGLDKFRTHENTSVHKEGVLKLSSLAKPSVAAQLNDQLNSDMKKARLALEIIFTTVKYLCRQGLAIRGHEDINSNFLQLLELRKKDVPELKDWLGRSGYKWISHDVQNEIIDILGKSVVRSVLDKIKNSEHFSIIVDETSDISIHEQVSFCVRTVSDDLIINEDFIGLYETPNTEAQTLFKIVKDIFARLNLPIEKLRGQCYDGAANMRGRFKGLQKLLLDIQPQAHYVHCTAHSLNLAVQDSLSCLPCMRDVMALAKDLINTVKESNKRINLFRNIRLESENDQANLRPLCPTRWTMRASSIQRILKNYEDLLQFFEIFSSTDKTEAGYKCAGFLESMILFRTYLFLNLYCHVMNVVEEVNENIQSPHLSVTEVEGMFKGLISILDDKRDGFEEFWKSCLKNKFSQVEEPVIPRKRRVPNRYENDGASSPHNFNTPKDYFKALYIEVCETVRSCIKERFESTGLSRLVAVEKEFLSVLVANEEGSSFEQSKDFFKNDLDVERLQIHLNMLADINRQNNLKMKSMRDVRKYLSQEPAIKKMLSEVVKVIKLLQVVPISSATAERSFSALRRLKTYLRSTMGQKRLNNLAVLHAHRDVLDEVHLSTVMNEFISSNELRRHTFSMV
ncbi:zinc finger MYM-type protein 1-like [Nilaparvata lugens]|uniref:zinc finger MYM-type protein 1-like n=4 Tax=Nilaparvata lugens TaxID=108931 RepID=UPI000B99BB6C|nr:zinc finger MYM-type protein 1-like [Nilaparvata lugens]